MEYHYTAVVLGKRERADADRIYTFYTKESGKIQALAKGVRKMEAKLAPHLENFTLSAITIVRTRGIGKVTTSVVEESFPHLHADVDALRATYRVLRLFQRLVDLEEKDERIFFLLREFLTIMDTCANVHAPAGAVTFLSCAFLFKMFPLLGYDISFVSCARCRRKIGAHGNAFDVRHRGILCAQCAQREKNGGVPISANVIKAMRLTQANTLSSLTKVRMPDADDTVFCAIADQFARVILA